MADIKTEVKSNTNENPGSIPGTKPLIYEAMDHIMQKIEAVGKTRQPATGIKYNYRSVDDVYNEVQPLMVQEHVFMTTTVEKFERTDQKSQAGNDMLHVFLTCRFRFNATDGSFVECTVIGEGLDGQDKATVKAQSTAQRICLTQAFLIPTEDEKNPTETTNTPRSPKCKETTKAKMNAQAAPPTPASMPAPTPANKSPVATTIDKVLNEGLENPSKEDPPEPPEESAPVDTSTFGQWLAGLKKSDKNKFALVPGIIESTTDKAYKFHPANKSEVQWVPKSNTDKDHTDPIGLWIAIWFLEKCKANFV